MPQTVIALNLKTSFEEFIPEKEVNCHGCGDRIWHRGYYLVVKAETGQTLGRLGDKPLCGGCKECVVLKGEE